jgi:hypothetical protein
VAMYFTKPQMLEAEAILGYSVASI